MYMRLRYYVLAWYAGGVGRSQGNAIRPSSAVASGLFSALLAGCLTFHRFVTGCDFPERGFQPKQTAPDPDRSRNAHNGSCPVFYTLLLHTRASEKLCVSMTSWAWSPTFSRVLPMYVLIRTECQELTERAREHRDKRLEKTRECESAQARDKA